MSTESAGAPQKARHETWSDWIREVDPDYDEQREEFETIDELVEDLNGLLQFRNAEINPSTIRYWQAQGLIPYPVKRWHEGATRALYPKSLAFRVMLRIRSLQLDRGYNMDQLKAEVHQMLRESIASQHDPSRYTLEPAILAVARQREQVINKKVPRVDVTFFDENGEQQTYTYETYSEFESLASGNGLE